MKCKRTPLEAEVIKYELDQNLEDGFESLAAVITKGWFVTDTLVVVTKEDGKMVCPYICHRRGRTFIGKDDYIIIDSDGTKHVCCKEKIFTRYTPID